MNSKGLGFRFSEDDLPRAAGDRFRAIGAIFREYREAAHLSPKQWEAVELYYCMDLGLSGTARTLKISRGAVRCRVNRAFSKMFDFALKTHLFS
ncbi:MAG: sigma factor-like helix-turn-helix DNA-binding protein [Planctomycetota bacterium]